MASNDGVPGAPHRRPVALLACLAGLWACEQDVLYVESVEPERPGAAPATDEPPTGATANGEASAIDPPLYVLGTRVWDDTTTTSYFHVVPSLEPGTVVDPALALEVPGAAKLYAVEGLGWFAVGGGESPTITRYTLEGGQRLVAGRTLSLQGYGVRDLWDTLYVVSATKAYYPDREGAQLITWNPTTMEITGVVPLPETVRDGYLALYGYTPISRGETLLFSVGWFDWDVTDTVLPETGLVSIDTETDTLLAFELDGRCGGITQSVAMADGDAYLVSSALAGAAHRLGRLATEPCALRVNAEEATFDSAYMQALGELMGGALAGEPVPAGNGSELLLRVFAETPSSVSGEMLSWELTGQPAWSWARWDVATNEVAAVDALGASTADVLWFRVGDRVLGTETTADYAETTLIDLGADGGPRPALTAPGFLHGVARVR